MIMKLFTFFEIWGSPENTFVFNGERGRPKCDKGGRDTFLNKRQTNIIFITFISFIHFR